jgi:hypothetical protein
MPLLADATLTKLDVSGIGFGSEGAAAIAKYISCPFAHWHTPNCAASGTLSVANVMGNTIGKEHLTKLQEIMRSKPNLISLCGIPDDATEADFYGLGMDADDAVILAAELPDKKALLSLNLASNAIGITNDTIDISFVLCSYPAGISGPEAIADAIKIMGALLSVNKSPQEHRGI